MISSLPIGEALRRAPVPFAAAFALGLALLRAAADDFDVGSDAVVPAAAAAFFGAAAGHGLARTAGAVAVALVATLAIVFAEPLMVTRWLLVAALALAALVSPMAAGRRSAEEAWRTLVRTVTAAGLGLLGALVVIAGIVLLTLSADALLGLDWLDIAWEVVTPLALGWLAPAVFLSLSEGERDERVAEALGLVAQTFARLVLTPLLAVYAVVLALYIGRIGTLGALPSGEIGWIVPLFGATGAVTAFALAALPVKGAPSRLFVRAWFPVTLLPVALYALAVGIRVDAYGVTPERYGAMLVGVWLGALAIGFTLAPRADVRLLPVMLVLTLALGAVGPWSMKPVVAKSLGDRIATALPSGELADQMRAMTREERQPVCSPVAALAEIGQLDRVERRLGVSGLEVVCGDPWRAEGTERLSLGIGGAFAIPAEGRVWVSGPHIFYGDDSRDDQSAGVSIVLTDAQLTVRTAEGEGTFDFVAIGREWQRDGGTGPFLASEGDITLAVREMGLTVTEAATQVSNLTVSVIVPRP